MLQVHSIRIHCILQSVIQLINQTSQGFKEGKKWKCNSRCGTRGGNSTRTFRDRLASQKTNTCRCKRICSQCDISDAEDAAMLSHSKTVDHSDVRIKHRSRQLVRQHATTSENSSENRRLKPAGGLPCRQWTTDASFSETDAEPSQTMKSKATSSPMVMSSNSNAFLLRPLSRNSAQPTKENQTPADLQSPAVKAAIAAAVAAAKGPKGTSPSDHLSMNSYGPEIRSAPNGTIHQSRLRKQRTTESAPNNHILVGGHIIRQIPRQQSNASAYSMAIPSTYSHQGITLVRGASCSLVDIPTYLGPITTGGMVEVAGKSKGTSAGALTQYGPRPLHRPPRLQLDLTKNNPNKNAKSTRKTKWTILCVGLTLLTMCVTLVGAMLSMGSHYEGMVVHRKWENEIGQPGLVISNQSSSTEKDQETTSMSPLLSILKIAKEDPDTNLLDEEEDEKVSRSSSVSVSTDNQKDRKKKLFGGKSFSRGRINTVVKKTAYLADMMKNAEDNFKRWS